MLDVLGKHVDVMALRQGLDQCNGVPLRTATGGAEGAVQHRNAKPPGRRRRTRVHSAAREAIPSRALQQHNVILLLPHRRLALQ